MSKKKRGALCCLAATIAVLLTVAVGALFLIAPVWQPGYRATGYQLQPATAVSSTNDETSQTPQAEPEPIELNTATAQQLMQLSGIGEGKAAAIIEFRQQNGGFSDVGKLAQVPGISQKMVDGWVGKIYVEQSEK